MLIFYLNYFQVSRSFNLLFICSLKKTDGGRDGEGGHPRAGHQGHGGPAQAQGGAHARRRDPAAAPGRAAPLAHARHGGHGRGQLLGGRPGGL